MGNMRSLALAVTMSVVLVACGGDNGDSETTTAAPTDPRAEGATTATAEASGDDGDTVPSGSAADLCEAIFPVAEMSDLFGEEAILDGATEESGLGQLVCNWSTIEDPEDLEDLAIEFVTLQLYSGDPIGGDSFYDTSFYGDDEELDGIGDTAFLSGDGASYNMGFLDGETAGFFSYTDADLGPSGPAPGIPRERAIELLTTFHDRAT